MSNTTRLSKTAIQIDNGQGRSRLTLISGGKGRHRDLCINFSGPKGGNQRGLLIASSDLLQALNELGLTEGDL